MGKLIAVVTRFLSLSAVLLAIPIIADAQPTRIADLRPTAILYNSADLVPGRTVFFDSGVRNSGSQGTGVFNIRWFVDGVSVGYGSHADVPPNSTVLDGNSQLAPPWVATAGTHKIEFAVDVDNHVLESNESNNSRSVRVTVTSQTEQPRLIFPFRQVDIEHPSETWVVKQGFNSGSHTGQYQFAFDLQRCADEVTCSAAGAGSEGNDAATENEDVLAAAPGKVVFAEEFTGCIAIRHNSFLEGAVTRWYFTIYCHLKTPLLLQRDDPVGRGDPIGTAWNTHIANQTCSNPCPPHIHFALFSSADRRGGPAF